MLKEYISKNLNVPFVYLNDKQKYLCSNGVLFTKEEYLNGINLQEEFVKRSKENNLYDYNYAKSTGFLRKQRAKVQEEVTEEKKELEVKEIIESKSKDSKSVYLICILLGFTSLISMYISTLHTAEYLEAYTGLISSWLMSASVTTYNSTAFEVSILFHKTKRNLMSFTFMFLWILVTLFSMATTVSVFYDAFNFQEKQISNENKQTDANKLALEILQKKENALREDIEFKKKDIEYRQEREWATTAVRQELTKLQEELQINLTSQENLLKETPEITNEKLQKKESLFSFLGRLLHLEGGILEFIMSTLSAIFINLIAPLSLSAVTELLDKNKKEVDKDKVNIV